MQIILTPLDVANHGKGKRSKDITLDDFYIQRSVFESASKIVYMDEHGEKVLKERTKE